VTQPNGLDDFKRIWRGQSTEDTKLTLEQVRQKARSLQLRRQVIGFVLLPFSIVMTILFSWLMWRAWVEHRPGGLLLIPIVVCLQGIPLSIKLIRTRRIAADAGFKTSVEVYRAQFELERALTPRVWGSFGALMLAGAIGAVDLWIQSPVFPAWDAAEFGVGYILIGVIVYLAIRYKNRQIDRALHIVHGLEQDIE
jgi:hypothetical protein